MSQTTPEPVKAPEASDQGWKDLYRMGGYASLLIAGSIIFAVAAFLIWPPTPGITSTEDILTGPQADRLGGRLNRLTLGGVQNREVHCV